MDQAAPPGSHTKIIANRDINLAPNKCLTVLICSVTRDYYGPQPIQFNSGDGGNYYCPLIILQGSFNFPLNFIFQNIQQN